MHSRIKRFLKKIWKKYRKIRYGIGYRIFGEGSIIRKPIRILGKKYISVGSNVDIMHGLRMEAVLEWGGSVYEPSINIQDNVTIGQNCHITCANEIIIAKGTSILPDVLITDIEHQYVKGKSAIDTGLNVGYVKIGENVTIGAGSTILGRNGITIGDNAVIGANSLVLESIREDVVAVGMPAREIRHL